MWRIVILCGLALMLPCRLSGEEHQKGETGGATPSISEKITVELVQFDVRAVDKSGNFVPGLGVQDFEVLEDGVPQILEYVDETGLEKPIEPKRPAELSVPPGEAAKPTGVSPINASLIVLVDSANSGLESVRRQRKALEQFVRLSSGSDLLIGVFQLDAGGAYGMVGPFTRDPEVAARALEKIQSGAEGSAQRRFKMEQLETVLEGKLGLCARQSSLQLTLCRDAAMDSLLENAKAYAQDERARAASSIASIGKILELAGHLPGKKSLLLVSEGIDPGGASYFNTAAQLLQYYSQSNNLPDTSRWIARIQQESTLSTSELPTFRILAENAASSDVTVYWMNPAHSESISPISPEHQLSGYPMGGTEFVNAPQPGKLMQGFAEDTGGLALPRAAGVEDFLGRIRKDFGRYYVLSYKPTGGRHEGTARAHKVEVRARRPGIEIRARANYVERTPAEQQQQKLTAALDFPDLYDLIPVATDLTYLRTSREKYTVIVRLAVPCGQILPTVTGDRVRDILHFGFVVRNEGGEIEETQHPILNLSYDLNEFNALVEGGGQIDYRQTFELEPGDYDLISAILDEGSGRTATRVFRVSLPRADAGGLAVTPLMMARSAEQLAERVPALVFDERGDARCGNMSLSFSTVRRFPPNGQLTGIYQLLNVARGAGGLPWVEIYFRLLKGGRTNLVNATPVTRIGRLTDPDGRSITNLFSVPYTGLRAGSYRLELVAKDLVSDRTARSGADFEIVEPPALKGSQ